MDYKSHLFHPLAGASYTPENTVLQIVNTSAQDQLVDWLSSVVSKGDRMIMAINSNKS